ncbi:MAG: hypothetical protein A3H51_00470 [Candidatus Spechtbacteria bacterium RIFCSPLOWO2_02_FULL_38_8]|uniref:Type II secretion system protein GspG C-terminal domain-containing protein n=1 Tax=Candidatus Spechtbacteria bacterium RIFCSPLOWO2_02_FULL_38_8 TaxID=1802164 RepID=A0A1G2HKG0_9BACT|nr:MAG: hypothetical protein A3H51_00470 [Candidatus Spechtbacteria bacterium RIFCSPLOWO2_02_FULL_38_8]
MLKGHSLVEQKINYNMTKLMNRSKGFTLIELLIVIAIIGLLASIVVVALQGPRITARDTKRQGDIKNMQTAMELCYGDSACGALESYVTYANYTAAKAGGIGIYIAAANMPDDPQSGSNYVWVDNSADDQTFCIYAGLEDGEAGKEMVYASETGFGYMATGSVDCP